MHNIIKCYVIFILKLLIFLIVFYRLLIGVQRISLQWVWCAAEYICKSVMIQVRFISSHFIFLNCFSLYDEIIWSVLMNLNWLHFSFSKYWLRLHKLCIEVDDFKFFINLFFCFADSNIRLNGLWIHFWWFCWPDWHTVSLQFYSFVFFSFWWW